ncbi:hypothetical protein [Streptomyces broussonetiae]|uniref:Uncharacterized protein n=1 Tax=Streptomyces broussonetiae TaxID=2686304 RepID=A0ABV5EFK7_9ACTN
MSAASAGPVTRSQTGTERVPPLPSRAVMVARRAPGAVSAGTVMVNGISARVRAGTRTPVSARVTRAAPVAHSRTVTGCVTGLVRVAVSRSTAPGGPSA